ncbi:hypothetical protein ACFXB4_10825 [Streptomyces lavendulae]|uniref:hypothetical protein n=1 Tax=Streptomyces lavendulae TaxID=1914 RepID=UPI0024A3EBC5|nr:hypothetical protein Sros01_70620 [Streptomyces roseochromogenus]
MDVLVEFVLPALVVLATGALARRTVSRRAAARTASASGGAVVTVPCRARWRQGARRRFFGYGKLGAGADGTGAEFKAPLRGAVAVPVGGRVAVRAGLRPGMRVLEYRAPDGRRVDFQVYDAEAARAARLLEGPDPAGR